MRSVQQPEPFSNFASPAPEATVKLPEPVAAPLPGPDVQPPPVRELEPVAEPAPVRIPGVERAREAKRSASARASGPAKTAEAPAKPRARSAPARKRSAERRSTQLQAWPASVSQGAYGRLVRIGTFSSRRQAKQGWARIVRVYPGMRRLRAVVVANPSRRTGQTLYRLQFGTTSQAHSTVLCQRMRIIGQSCVVVGLPGRQGGVAQ